MIKKSWFLNSGTEDCRFSYIKNRKERKTGEMMNT
jgi:hypothetical protein